MAESKPNQENVFHTFLYAFKNRKFKSWFYEFKHGHKFLIKEEADIICETRFDDKYKYMNDAMIQALIKIKVKAMYKTKFPNAKQWELPVYNCN